MDSLKTRIRYYFFYCLFWITFFFVARCIFLLFNIQRIDNFESSSDFFAAFYYGSKLDLSATFYLLLIPTVLLIFNSIFQKINFKKGFFIYTILLLAANVLLVISDAAMYDHWGNRLDMSVWFYLQDTQEVLNFIPVKNLIINLVSMIALFAVFYFFYKKFIHPLLVKPSEKRWSSTFVFLLLGIISIIPIRGGIGLNPLNLSNVYFSNNTFLNHTSINSFWNFMYTISERDKLTKTFEYMKPEKANQLFQTLYPKASPAPNVLHHKTPNIVLVILESFTSKLINKKWNGIEITPNLNRRTQEGIFFSEFYASGDRTDEGLVSILSGYPAQPQSFIINYQKKTAKLPSLTEDLKALGYTSTFYYGGDVNFANMKSYLLQKQVDHILDKSNFPSETFNAKWGVHDHVVFEKALDDISKTDEPFFKILLTLSSHPPFDVPMEKVIEGEDNNSLFANSAHYTDQALGNFITRLSQTPKWENTLVVLVADHSIPYLDDCKYFAPEKYKIPMLWLGGALSIKDSTITKVASQTDFVNTLLSQMGQGSEQYPFSKNILSPDSKSFAFYTYNNGFGFLNENSICIFDNTQNKYRKNLNSAFPQDIGKAYLQKVSEDFSKK